MKVSEIIVRSLEEYGSKRIYGLIGTSILELVDAAKNSGIRYVSTRHEQVAVSMADGEARVTGRIGIAFVHGGPGFLNSLISLANAYKDSSPLLVVAGAVKRRMVGLDSWLEVPQQEMAKGVTKRSFRVERGNEASSVISEALSVALSAPFGPVVVEIPEDVLALDAGVVAMKPRPIEAPAPSHEDVGAVARGLFASARPVLLLGGGSNNERGAQAAKKLVDETRIPVVTTGNGRGTISEEHQSCLGRAGFGGGNTVADYALRESDVVVALGAGISDVTTYGFNLRPKGEVFVVDLDPLWEKKPIPCRHIAADAPSFAGKLAQELRGYSVPADWLAALQLQRTRWNFALDSALKRRREGFVNPSAFLRRLDEMLPSNTVLAAGQGLHILYTYAFMKVRAHNSFLAATNMGSMGFVFPAALGAKMAEPWREVVAVMGDGEFLMTVQDLETAVREKAGVKLVVINDNSYRVLLMRQKIQKMGRVHGTLHSNPDMVKLADAFGAEAKTVSSDSEMESGLEFISRKSEVPLMVELKVDQEDLPPLNLEGSLMF